MLFIVWGATRCVNFLYFSIGLGIVRVVCCVVLNSLGVVFCIPGGIFVIFCVVVRGESQLSQNCASVYFLNIPYCAEYSTSDGCNSMNLVFVATYCCVSMFART